MRPCINVYVISKDCVAVSCPSFAFVGWYSTGHVLDIQSAVCAVPASVMASIMDRNEAATNEYVTVLEAERTPPSSRIEARDATGGMAKNQARTAKKQPASCVPLAFCRCSHLRWIRSSLMREVK